MEAGRLLASGSPEEILTNTRQSMQMRVGYADGASEVVAVPEGMSQGDLLRHLVLNGEREVISFTPAAGDLEDVFMSVTEGIVQ